MSDAMHSHSFMFGGQRILMVEARDFVTEELRQKLDELGALIVGPVTNVGDALARIGEDEVDGAILDLKYDGQTIFPVVEALEASGIPYIFALAPVPADLPAGFTGFVLCTKRNELDHIARALFGRGRHTFRHGRNGS